MGKDGMYDLDFKNSAPHPDKIVTGAALMDVYKGWFDKYAFVSIEDPFDQDDWEAYTDFTKRFGEKVQVVGDDLLVTNTKRISKALDCQACNALLLKVNQIGSITESIDAANMCSQAGWGIMVSHRAKPRTPSSRTWLLAFAPVRLRRVHRAAASAWRSTISYFASKRSSGPRPPSRVRASGCLDDPTICHNRMVSAANARLSRSL